MKFIYDFVAGNSRVTPAGVTLAALSAAFLVHAGYAAAGASVFVGVIVATLAGSVFEKER